MTCTKLFKIGTLQIHPCNENRVFPVYFFSQGKPCSGPVLALYGIAVYAINHLGLMNKDAPEKMQRNRIPQFMT